MTERALFMSVRLGLLAVALLLGLGGVAGWRLGGRERREGMSAGRGSGDATWREIEDMCGRRLRWPANPSRLLCLSASAGAVVEALGQAARIAAIDEHGAVVPALAATPVVCKGGILAREQVVSLGIDGALLWWYQDDLADALGKLGVPVYRLRQPRAAELPELARRLGDCLGCEEQATALADRLALPPPATVDRETAPSVYLELYGAYRTVGADSYLSDIIAWAGGRNAVAADGGGLLVTPEALLRADPELVLLVAGFATPAEFAARPGMAGLRAVRAGRVHLLNRQLLLAGPAFPEAVQAVRQWLAEVRSQKSVFRSQYSEVGAAEATPWSRPTSGVVGGR